MEAEAKRIKMSAEQHLVDDSPEKDETSQKEQEHLTPFDATPKLLKFRPVISKPSDLNYLLERNADPNMPVPSDNAEPLRNMICFASENHVVQMRLLLDHGAKESEEDKARWDLRQQATFCERLRLSNEWEIMSERGSIE